MADAKAEVVRAIRDGCSVKDAMQLVQRAPATYIDWRKHDSEFAQQIDAVREVARAARSRSGGGRPEVPDFPEFCADYLNMPMPEHHLRIWDVLNGRLPRSMHPSIRYQKGRDGRLMVTLPPWHAKTQVWTVNYCVWRMCADPNVRIAVVSQTQEFAKKIIHQVKQILAMPQYAKLQAAFMPEGGWKGDSWTKTAIYLAGVDQAQKDPTLQALGLNGQIYGSRLDVILCDDLVTGKNAHLGKELADWIGSEVSNRMDDDGQLTIVGTRMGANDLYAILREQMEWDGEDAVWTYFAQPAVLEMPEPHPSTWMTLWPAKWPGLSLAKLKAEATAARWALTYQQMDAVIDQVFPAGAVAASIDGSRAAGKIDGLYTVLGVDPAASGFTAMIVMGLDRASGRRFVLDGFNVAKCPPDLMISKIKHFIEVYRCREAIIEQNAFQSFVSNLEDIRDHAFRNGCLINPHQTGSNKWDSDLGVASMSALFQSCADHDVQTDAWTKRPTDKHLISLPNPKFSTFVSTLTDQLVQWQPLENKRQQTGPTDLVMALWMANLGVQKELDKARNRATHLSNQFLPRMDQRRQAVVNLAQLAEAKHRLGSDLIYDFGTGRPV